MKAKHFKNADGEYIGSFVNGAPSTVGAVEIEAPPNDRVVWLNGEWIIPPIPPASPPTTADVNAERQRRLALDFSFNGKLFQRDPVSIARISGAGVLALGAIVGGAQVGNMRWQGETSDFGWIASDNSVVTMDAQTMFAFGQAAANVESTLVFAARALRAMDPIPTDYATNDDHWT